MVSGDSIALQGRKVQLGDVRTVSACESGDWSVCLVVPQIGAVRVGEWSTSSVERICHGSNIDD